MYKLSFSPASPYVRKVRMAAFKAGMDKKLELITANTQDEKDDIRNLNIWINQVKAPYLK
jgi:glutathione S-transferase